MPKKIVSPVIITFSIASLISLLAGCHRPAPALVEIANANPAPRTAPAAKPALPPRKPAPLTTKELVKIRPNEVGVIPILEYHEIRPVRNRMDRSAKAFRRDLEKLYKDNFRPITMRSYLENRIALPPGKSPVVLTFDDARDTQFRYLPDGTIDPNCAVGILQAFAKKHPDFPVRGTFFILPRGAFGQIKSRAKKIKALLDMGCEIGNHTVNHPMLRRLSDERVQSEIARNVALVRALVPSVKVDTLALPGGVLPRNRRLLPSGNYKKWSYRNKAVFLAGAEPSPSPVSKHYKPMLIPRVLAVEEPQGITYWLNYLKSNRKERYISDGDPKTITVPRTLAVQVNKDRLQGAKLRVYETEQKRPSEKGTVAARTRSLPKRIKL